MRFILTLLLLAAHCATLTRAIHCSCTWKLGKKPGELGYERWCTAPVSSITNGQATYHCDKNSPGNHAGKKVADWNVLRPKVLEFATPCGGGGYAAAWGCPAIDWAVCIDRGKFTDCLGLKSHDDCESDVNEGNSQRCVSLNNVNIPGPWMPPGEWSEPFKNPPAAVEIWHLPD